MPNLFTYGTLMCQDIMLEVAGCYPARCRGILTGYSRHPIKEEVYPAIIPDETGIVQGVLYFDISTQALERLDRFEGEMYSRQSVEITLSDETSIPAKAYILQPYFLDYVVELEWGFDNFLLHHKWGFRQNYNFYQV